MSRAIRSGMLALMLMASEAAAQFCPGLPPWVFDDVPITHPFCTDITWMAQRGVTLGCALIDPNHRLYCPDANVDRGQMAAFMHRLGDALLPLSCAPGQVMKWDGLQWACANDNIGGSGGGGTVTSFAAGTGLTATPNPIIAAGVMSVDTTTIQSRVSGSCAVGSSIRAIAPNGTVTCEVDDAGTGTVTSLSQGTGITLSANPITTTGSIAADTTYLQRRVSQSCIAGSSIRAIAADGSVTCETDNTGPANAFVQGGNSFGAFGTLGTNDNQTLALRANGLTSLKIQPTTADPTNGFNTATPNIIGGWEVNAAFVGVIGATIGGGGGDFEGLLTFNLVTDHYGTVGGGLGNRAGDAAGTVSDRRFATVGGGYANRASGDFSTVSGGQVNTASAWASMVGGGQFNTANAYGSAVGGGSSNTTSGDYSTVGGGGANTASGALSTVGGGLANTASGPYSTVVGGRSNEAPGDYSIAMGRRAKAFNGINIGHGTIVIADGNDFDFSIGTDNRFGVRATGGFYFVTAIDGVGTATAGVSLGSGDSSWNVISDRAAKANWRDVDGREVLAKLVEMPIGQWHYKAQDASIQHIGPAAQDFRRAFGLGRDDNTIATVDADGIALAAIQGLNAKLEAKLAEQNREIAEPRRAVGVLLSRISHDGRTAQGSY